MNRNNTSLQNEPLLVLDFLPLVHAEPALLFYLFVIMTY